VLNVNDDSTARTYKSALLTAAGFDVIDAARGDEAMRLVHSSSPDFILLDVHLPDDNGIDICRRLQPIAEADAFEGDRPFAIALISAHVTQPEDIARGMSAGADAYLVEPLDDTYLTGLVRALADRHIRRRAAASERKALRERDYRYKVLQATVGDTIYDWNLATDTVEWSDAAYRMLGYAPQQVGQRSQWWVDRIHPDDRARVMFEVRRALEDQKVVFETEYRFCRADGTFAVVVDRSTIIYDADGRPARTIGAMSDITERRRLAEQLRLAQKMEAVGLLAGGIAHDFNNVLTSVIGFTDLARLEQNVAPSGIDDHLDEIERAARRGSDLITQLLAFSRQQLLKNEVLDLNEVIRSSTKMLDRLIGAHIRVSHRLVDAAAAVRADRTQLEQVLLNLIVNARDAMPDGGELQVTTTIVNAPRGVREARTLPLGRYACLTVSDTGMGMDDATRARIFEPFFTTKDRGRGTGLGLSTVYGIIKQSGGYITVHSSRGAGTTFEILLPALDEAAISVPTAAVAPQPGISAGETVLVVEDEQSVRRMAGQMLARAGYRVLEAGDGHEALAVASDHRGPIHLLLTDVVLPGLSGVAVAESLKTTRPDIRVLYTSGYGDDGPPLPFDLDTAPKLLSKPFTHDALMREVREALASDSGSAALG
jgi:PAS domain S-box-containing protein